MAYTWELTEADNDLTIVNGQLATVSGATEIRQRIIVALRHNWREYFLNIPAGVPWYDYILGSRDRRAVESILRRAILDVPGVLGLTRFVARWDVGTRVLTFEFSVEVRTSTGLPEIAEANIRAAGDGGVLSLAFDWVQSIPLPIT